MSLLLAGLLVATLIAVPATAAEVEQGAVDTSVAAAAAAGIDQSVAVLDRATGEPVASSGSDQQYISESIVKLFTVAYYESGAGDASAAGLSQKLRTMIEKSDDEIESELWNTNIVPAMAQRYGLEHTGNGPRTGPHDWGWELITAGDEVKILYEMSNDSKVAPLLLDAMANVAASGSDGFDQEFGLNALPGDHGSKQGWTDTGQDDGRAQVHSVGWTDKYFVAILQTSTSADDDTMRTAATSTAEAIVSAESGPPATVVPAVEDPSVTAAPSAVTTASDSAATDQDVTGQLAGAIRQMRHDVGSVVELLTGRPNTW